MIRRSLLVLLCLALSLATGACVSAYRVEQRYPPIGQFIDVDGLRLHYKLEGQGDGPALLLVHGASSNLREFSSDLMPRLAAHHRVIAFDRPGYGYSERPDGEWLSPEKLAALMLDACEQLGIDKPVIVGHSWGGSVVMAALVKEPNRVAGGVLLSGVTGHWAGSLGFTYEVGALPVIGPMFAWTVVPLVGPTLLPTVVKQVVAPEPVPPNYIDAIGAPLALRPHTFINNAEDMSQLNVYLQSLSTEYDQIRLPLLMIHGDQDALVPFWNHGRRVLPLVPQTRLLLIPGAGHALHHTHVDEVANSIEQFVTDLPALTTAAAHARDTATNAN